MTELERLSIAEKQLDRVQAFFPRVDQKTSALFAVAAGEAAIACINVSIPCLKTWWSDIPLTALTILLGGTFWLLYRCAFPHLDGGQGSLIYFREIGRRTELNFTLEWKKQSSSELTADILGQVWRNSAILTAKFDYLRYASICIAWSILPLCAFLAAASFTSSKIFLIHS